jgi:quercetin dioxygenase-like cupin family protein
LQGQPDRVLKAGDSYLIPIEAPHGGRAGPEKLILIANFCVEKDKPLLSGSPYTSAEQAGMTPAGTKQ